MIQPIQIKVPSRTSGLTISLPDAVDGGKGGEGGVPVAEATPLPASPPLAPPAAQNAVADALPRPAAEVFIPAPVTNPVLAALQGRGLYLRPCGDGQHEVTCPWSHQHQGSGIQTARYAEPSEDASAGRYACPHGHTGRLQIGELLSHLDVGSDIARCRPTIRLIAGEMSQIARCTEKVLAERGTYYQSGGMIVSVRVDPLTGDVTTEPVTEQALTRELASATDWEKWDGRSKAWVRTDPPPRYVQLLLKSQSYEHLPLLEGLARQPYLRRLDGNIVHESGYDRTARVLGVFNPAAYTLPEPTMEAAQEALAALKELVAEFHFAGEADRSASLSAMLTATVRGALPYAPAFNITASGSGSGKSYLAAVIAPFGGPGEPMNVSYPTTSEEATKAMLSVLARKPAVVLFDDMQTDWKPHGVMNRMLTSPTIADRLLGSNRTLTVSTASFFMGTGNNVEPERDMRRRVITIYIAPQCETPTTISYTGRPVELIRGNRERYVSHALTIVRAWIEAGRPRADVPTIATFGNEWSDLCRQPLLWLGEADPATSLILQVTADPDKEALGALLQAWYTEFGNQPMTLRKVVDKAEDHRATELADALAELPVNEKGSINRNKFGWYLKKNANRLAGGLKVVSVPSGERNSWSVLATEGAVLPVARNEAVPVENTWAKKPERQYPIIDPNDVF